VTEREWQKIVVDLAHLHGWHVAHFRAAGTRRGWRTAVQYEGAGYPDLTLARDRVVIFAELKTDTGRVSCLQQGWLDVLPNSFVWRPKHFDEIQEKLKR